MKLFSLTVDFAFKALFAPNPDLLISLVNSFPSFQGENKVVTLKVLNPEIPKEISSEKFSILDIRAENEKGESFLIEMQAFPQGSFTKRILYYWAKVYSRGLNKGENYDNLKKVYSINFVKKSIWKNKSDYFSRFYLLEKNGKIPLTEDLEIHIVELEKFLSRTGNLETDLENWVYLLKESSNLKGEIMKTLERKNPSIKKAISELKNISRSKKNRELYDARLKAELDYNSGINGAYRQGLQEGIEKGIEEGIEEGIYLGIQINLESRFNIQNDSIMKQIRKVKSLEKLKKILLQSSNAKTLNDFKKILKRFQS